MAGQYACGRRTARWFLFGFAVVYSVMTTGLLLGWSAVVLMLNGEGTLSHLCEDVSNNSTAGGSPLTCAKSDVFISGIFVTGQAVTAMGPLVLGTVIDRVGPRKGAATCGVCVTIGLLVVAAGMKGGRSATTLLPLGFALTGGFGSGVQFTSFHIANVFEELHGTVTSTMSASFGVSSLVYPLMHAIWKASGATMQSLFYGMSVITALLTLYGLTLPDSPFELGDTCAFTWSRGFHVVCASDGAAHDTDSDPDTARVEVSGQHVGTPYGDASLVEQRSDGTVLVHWNWGRGYLQADAVRRSGPASEGAETQGSMSLVRAMTSSRTKLTLWQRISSVEFISLVSFLAVAFWKMNFFISSANIQLKLRAGVDEGNNLTGVLAWMAPLGIVSAPLSGYLMDKYGLHAVAGLSVGLSLAHHIFTLIPVNGIQPLAFFAYTTGLETLFAWFFASVGRIFGFEVFGAMSGLAFVMMGVLILPTTNAIDGIVESTRVTPAEGFKVANIVFACLTLPLAAYIVYLRRWELRQKQGKEAADQKLAALAANPMVPEVP